MAYVLPDVIECYVGRANTTFLQLQYKPLDEANFVTVGDGVVSRANFRFGSYCIDTNVLTDPIELIESSTVVSMQLGLVTGLLPGRYDNAVLTIYDEFSPSGIAWIKASVQAYSWPVCGE